MKVFRISAAASILSCILVATAPAGFAADSASFEFGTGDKTKMFVSVRSGSGMPCGGSPTAHILAVTGT